MNLEFCIPRESLPEIVAKKIEELIIGDTSNLNKKLPSEQSLAVSFGVSRPVIREAMKILKTRGLIEQKNGEGNFICEPDSSFISDTFNRIIHLKKIDAASVFEVRINLEIMAARLASEKASEADFDELQEINNEMRGYKDNIEKRTEFDLKFHKKIAQASGNPLLEVFIESIAMLLFSITKYTLNGQIGNEEGIEYHDKIIAVLRSRNTIDAENIIRLHLLSSIRNFELANKLANNTGNGET